MARVLARDLGLQPERTRMAWRRTVLAGAVVALLAGRLAARDPLVVAAAVSTWLVLLRLAYWRIRAMAAHQPVPLLSPVPVFVAGTVVAFAVLGVVEVLR